MPPQIRLPKFSPRKLKQLREKAGLSVIELAAASGIDRNSVYRFERGDNEPMASTLYQLANALGVKADELGEQQ